MKANLIKQPNFTIRSWLRHTMSIIVEQNSLRFGIFATCCTKFPHVFHSGIQLVLVASLPKVRQIRLTL